MATESLPDGFDYQGDVYRPPAEADSIILQATLGCSHNRCTFCGAYRRKRFALKETSILERDLLFAERYCKRQERVFVLDGNALTMPMPRWIWLLESIRERLPWVKGSAAFGTGMDIAAKSDSDLEQLKALGLDRLYVGVESGHAAVLKQVEKGIDPEGLLLQCRRAREAGMELIVSVVLGVADDALSLESARATGRLLSAINPEEVGVTMLVPQPRTLFAKNIADGTLQAPGRKRLLAELRELFIHTELAGGLFNATHSSCYLSFKARLPEQRAEGLACIDGVLAGDIAPRQGQERRI